MSEKSNIQWTDATWNPVVGCSKMSAGCDNCYAEKMAHRLACNSATQATYSFVSSFGKWNGLCILDEKALQKPLSWKKPRRVFVNSMGDLFHNGVPYGWVEQVMAVMALCPQHTFMVLTKRPERMQEYFKSARGVGYKPLSNLWLGVSVEDQESAHDRIPALVLTPAVKRFISIEPLLAPVSLRWIGGDFLRDPVTGKSTEYDALKKIDWVIVGGENGAGARDIFPAWVRSIRDQAEANNIPFFFKGWGKSPRFTVKDNVSGCRRFTNILDGKQYESFPN